MLKKNTKSGGRPWSTCCVDNVVLNGSVFEPSTEPLGVTVVVGSAMLVSHAFYRRFARHLAARGFRVLTCDNRGAGESLRRLQRTRPQLRHWGERDIPAIVRQARIERPEDRLVFAGHSMGGQIVGLSEAVHEFDALVTVAATAAWWGHWPWPHSATILAWYLAAPAVGRVLPVLPAARLRVGPDVDFRVVRDWVRWGRHPEYLRGPFGHRSHDGEYTGRVLALCFSDDVAFGCRAAVEALHKGFSAAELEIREVEPATVGVKEIGHFGFFRRDCESLWDEVADWFD